MQYYQEDFKHRLKMHTKASASLAKSPRYNQQSALERLQRQFPDYHPLTALAQLVHFPNLPIGDQIAIHTTLAKYVAPQLKQLDIHAQIDSEVLYRPRIMRFDGSVDADDAEDAEIIDDPAELFV